MGRRERRTGNAGVRARRWAALGIVLVAVAAILVVLAVRGTPSDQTVAPVNDAVRSTASPSAPAARVAETQAPKPQRLRIDSIGVSADIVGLGLNPDRTVEVPQNPAQTGWFSEGPVPGQAGSSVVLGHVDSVDGPAVFHGLDRLRPGDPIEVERSDGSVARFEVGRLATYANEDFPAQDVYAGSPDRPALNLVTCGGEFDTERGGWQSNVIVFAEYIGTTAGAA